jgi:hypothetical protein
MPFNVPPPGTPSSAPALTPVVTTGVTPKADPASPAAVPSAPVNTFTTGAAVVAPAQPALELRATQAESRVLETARQLNQALPDMEAGLRRELAQEYGQWQAAVAALVKAGAVASKAVASFTSKIQQAALVHENMPAADQDATGKAYRDAALQSARYVVSDVDQSQLTADPTPNPPLAQADQSGLARVIADNPLVTLPPLAEPHTLPGLLARRPPPSTVQVTVTNAAGQAQAHTVRSDVVLLFCPGLLTDTTQFVEQSSAAIDAGIYATRVPTGTLVDPDENAKAIDQAIKDAKATVHNPNAKVVLVGYSQGSTNVFAFMRDKGGTFAATRKDVVAIHTMHSAARGSQTVDATNAVWKYVSGQTLDADEQRLADALTAGYNEAGEKQRPPALPMDLNRLRAAYQQAQTVLGNPAVAATLGKLGVKTSDPAALAQGLLGLLLQGTDWTQALAAAPGGAALAAQLSPLWQALLAVPIPAAVRSSMGDPNEDHLAGYESCGTAYGAALMNDPLLKQHVAGIPILNSVGRVPADRSDELVPPSNQPYWNMFRRLGLASDYQVAVGNQQLSGALPNAIDLPADAIGHWGEAHVSIPGEDDDAATTHFSATGLTRSVLATLQALGTL